jgi:uncharacterized damage-inducible protein DinB
MTIAQAMIAEFSNESKGTRKMLERLPEDKFTWKPHQKSMSLGELATHIAHIPHWAETILNDDQFDMSTADFNVEKQNSRQGILDYFDGKVEAFKKTLDGKSDEHLSKSWKLINEGHVAVDMPRAACLRAFIISHIIHHRGQLSVYLRENDVPLPALYGPSADEPM